VTLAEDLKPALRSIRGIPGELGLRPYTVDVFISSWSGSVVGEGTETKTSFRLYEDGNQNPKVRFLRDDQLALAGLPAGSLKVGPITPNFAGGGTTWDSISGGDASAGESFYFVLSGPEFPDGARFILVGRSTDHAMHYVLTLKPYSTDS
jgi:hypothetical protein